MPPSGQPFIPFDGSCDSAVEAIDDGSGGDGNLVSLVEAGDVPAMAARDATPSLEADAAAIAANEYSQAEAAIETHPADGYFSPPPRSEEDYNLGLPSLDSAAPKKPEPGALIVALGAAAKPLLDELLCACDGADADDTTSIKSGPVKDEEGEEVDVDDAASVESGPVEPSLLVNDAPYGFQPLFPPERPPTSSTVAPSLVARSGLAQPLPSTAPPFPRQPIRPLPEPAKSVPMLREAVAMEAEGYKLFLSSGTYDGGQSGYKGVTKMPNGTFTANYYDTSRAVGYRNVGLGTYDTAVEAAVAYAKHMEQEAAKPPASVPMPTMPTPYDQPMPPPPPPMHGNAYGQVQLGYAPQPMLGYPPPHPSMYYQQPMYYPQQRQVPPPKLIPGPVLPPPPPKLPPPILPPTKPKEVVTEAGGYGSSSRVQERDRLQGRAQSRWPFSEVFDGLGRSSPRDL